MTRPHHKHLALAALVTLALAVAACGRNSPTTVLIPTGIRPAPAVPTGGLSGFVEFDTATYPGVDQPSFPPATVQLFRDAVLVREVRTLPTDRAFLFERLSPGDYGLVVRSHAFNPRTFGPFRVVSDVRDAGDMRLFANTLDSLASLTYVIGTIPGFGVEELGTFSTYCDANIVGVWTYPNVLFPPGTPVPAGTYRVKFVTDASSTAGHLIGWGGVGSDTLTAPVQRAAARFGTDATTDLVVRFPASGIYAFTFDERRLSIDIVLVPPGPAATSATAAAAARPSLRSRLP